MVGSIGDAIVTNFPLTLGQRVRLHRVALRWRQVDLADEAGVPPHCVSAVERDLPTYPAAKQRILEALGLEGDIG